MRGTYLKLAGFDGPTSISSTAIAPGGSLFPASSLDNVFDRAEYYLSLAIPASTAFGSTSGASAGKVEAQPVGLNLTGGTAIPPLLGAFLQGQSIPKAYLYSTDIGGPGGKDWVNRFWVFAKVLITQVQTYQDQPAGDYPIQFVYGAALLGHVATPGATPVVTGWNFVANQPWNGSSPVA